MRTGNNEIIGGVSPASFQGNNVVNVIQPIRENRTPETAALLSGVDGVNILLGESAKPTFKGASVLGIGSEPRSIVGANVSLLGAYFLSVGFSVLAVTSAILFAVLYTPSQAVDGSHFGMFLKESLFLCFYLFGMLLCPLLVRSSNLIRISSLPSSVSLLASFLVALVVRLTSKLLTGLALRSKTLPIPAEIILCGGVTFAALGASFRAVFHKLTIAWDHPMTEK